MEIGWSNVGRHSTSPLFSAPSAVHHARQSPTVALYGNRSKAFCFMRAGVIEALFGLGYAVLVVLAMRLLQSTVRAEKVFKSRLNAQVD